MRRVLLALALAAWAALVVACGGGAPGAKSEAEAEAEKAWHEGGLDLKTATMGDWRAATAGEKLATASRIAGAELKREAGESPSEGELRTRAEWWVKALDAARRKGGGISDGRGLSEIAATVMAMREARRKR
jgi:hypothetical protein